MSDQGSYDLIEQPWILVQRLDGRVCEVSIRELFATASELRSIVGELPTQTFAILRVLLAVLHRAVDGPQDGGQWRELWDSEQPPMEQIDSYLSRFSHHFDLLHPETPFFQVADLHTKNNEVFGLERLIADVPTGQPYFTTRWGTGLERLGFAEAARWVVHCQAYDPSGIKSGAVGDQRVKGGKGYPIGTGWAGALGGVVIEGNDLRETLLLNLVAVNGSSNYLQSSSADAPAWERDYTAAERADNSEPCGPLDLYTWQSRRIRLFHDGESVTGVLITNGDKITPQNRLRLEPMSIWRRSEAQEKKKTHGPVVYMPKVHRPERSIWRGLSGLLAGTVRMSAGSDPAAELAPATLEWIGELCNDEFLPDDFRVRARTIGMEYGSQQATSAEVIDDALSMSIVLLAERGAGLQRTAIDAAEDAESGAVALGNLAANLARAAGGDPVGPKERAKELAYDALDREFRPWLARLDSSCDVDDERARWHTAAAGIIRDLGAELVQQAGPSAWRGREVELSRGNTYLVNIPIADRWFRGRVAKVFWAARKDQHDKEVA